MIRNIIFDFGAVLLDWNPEHLYGPYFKDEARMRHFLTEICPYSWNTTVDAGRSTAEATAERIALHPEWEKEIRMYYGEWTKMMGGQNSHLPLRLNTAGVIPPIFASSLLLFPATIGQFSSNEYVKLVADFFSPHGIMYNVIYVALIVFFCYFYTAIIFDPKDIAENLKKAGGFVPGIRPGERTQEYIDGVLSRLTLSGAVYISLVSLLPMLLIAKFNVPFYFGGTSLLILVGVAIDFRNQIESHMISSQYEGLMNKARKTGRM